MKQEKIIDALNDVNPEYIDEAAPKVKTRSRLRPWLAMAACLALVVGIFAGVRLIRTPAKPEPVPQGPSPYETAEDGPKAGIREDGSAQANADAETILGYRFGPLYLGMPFDDVKALYGEPAVTSNSGPITYEDGIARDSAGYKLAEGTERRSDLSLQLADAGDGWVVNEILLWENCGLELPHGVKLGMTDAELRAVWPEIAEEARYEADAGEGEKNGMKYTCSSYSQSSGHLRFGIYLENGVVYCVDLGLYYEDPPWEVDTPAPEEPYSFSSGEITVWRRTDEGWESTLKTEHGAKVLETVFSIEDLVPLEDELWPVQYVVDFQNGTVCLVCAPQEGITAGPNVPPDAWGAVYHLEDRDAFEASLAAGEAVPRGLTCLRQCVFPYGTWDTLSEAFE